MDIKLASDPHVSKTELSFESGPYDGILPVRSFFTAHTVHHLNPDRLAIATVLLLKPYICGPITLAKPCSPEVAKGLEDFLAPLNIGIMSVNYAPFAKPTGARKAQLLLPSIGEDNFAADGFDLTFGLASTQEYLSVLGVEKIKVSCNLRALAPDDPILMAQAVLGLSIMCAEDAAVEQIICPPQLVENTENFDVLARTVAFSNIIIGE